MTDEEYARMVDPETPLDSGIVEAVRVLREALDLRALEAGPFSTVLADPPWRFQNRTGKVAPEHRRLSRYDTMTAAEVCALPVQEVVTENAHLYLWVPNALIADGLRVMEAWGFTYKSNIVWAKRRKDGGPDGRGVGFYFRNVTELILFGVRGHMRTLEPGRRQVNMIETRKREHSRKPDEQYEVIEACSPGPYLEMFARYARPGWISSGLEADDKVEPRGKQYPSYGMNRAMSPADQAWPDPLRPPPMATSSPENIITNQLDEDYEAAGDAAYATRADVLAAADDAYRAALRAAEATLKATLRRRFAAYKAAADAAAVNARQRDA